MAPRLSEALKHGEALPAPMSYHQCIPCRIPSFCVVDGDGNGWCWP